MDLFLCSLKVRIEIKIPDLWRFNKSSFPSKEFSHHHVHKSPIYKFVIFIIDVFDEFHNLNAVTICRYPSLEFWMLLLNGFEDTEDHMIESFFQVLELFEFFSRIAINDVFDICPNDSLAFLMKGSALLKLFWASFAHEGRHGALRVYTDWITTMSVNALWYFFHFNMWGTRNIIQK